MQLELNPDEHQLILRALQTLIAHHNARGQSRREAAVRRLLDRLQLAGEEGNERQPQDERS